MQGYVMIVFITFHLATLSLSDSVIKENDRGIELNDAYASHHKLFIFPKNTMKFVATPTPYANRVYVHKPKKTIMPKISLVPHVTPKPKDKYFATTLARRKPLMKLKTFTIKSRKNGKLNGVQKDSQNNAHYVNKSENIIGLNTRTDLVIERDDIVTEVYVPQESQITGTNLQRLGKKDNKTQKYKQEKEPRQNKDKFLSEEEQDRNEFIFLNIENQQHGMVDMLDNIGQRVDEDFQTTTEFKIAKKLERVKRSKNIIEEENIAPTVSGLKYTGRDTRLNANFYFKNINS